MKCRFVYYQDKSNTLENNKKRVTTKQETELIVNSDADVSSSRQTARWLRGGELAV